MYEQHLEEVGLSRHQASIYEILIKNGSMQAGRIAKKAGITRPLTYKILNELLELGLCIKKEEKNKPLLFMPAHPYKIQDLIEKRMSQAKEAQLVMRDVIGKMTSDFNLILGKPNVRFFEGLDGMKKVLDDSLTAKGEIYTYADIESIQKYIPEINKEYVEERDRLGISKKAILLDTLFAREFLSNYHRETTDFKFIKYDAMPFQTVMQIYDNKISYLTLGEKDLIGVIIEDPHIYAMHKYIFEYIWSIS